MEKPNSLALAWDVQRKNRVAKPTDAAAAPVKLSKPYVETERPGSLADAILAKRKAAQPKVEDDEAPELEASLEENDGYGEPIPLSLTEEDISAPPAKLPFPTNRAEAIRAKLKAMRGDE